MFFLRRRRTRKLFSGEASQALQMLESIATGRDLELHEQVNMRLVASSICGATIAAYQAVDTDPHLRVHWAKSKGAAAREVLRVYSSWQLLGLIPNKLGFEEPDQLGLSLAKELAIGALRETMGGEAALLFRVLDRQTDFAVQIWLAYLYTLSALRGISSLELGSLPVLDEPDDLVDHAVALGIPRDQFPAGGLDAPATRLLAAVLNRGLGAASIAYQTVASLDMIHRGTLSEQITELRRTYAP